MKSRRGMISAMLLVLLMFAAAVLGLAHLVGQRNERAHAAHRLRVQLRELAYDGIALPEETERTIGAYRIQRRRLTVQVSGGGRFWRLELDADGVVIGEAGGRL